MTAAVPTGDPLGLPHGQNRIVPHDPRWPLLFDAERQRLAAVLGATVQGIEHYGSTSVPGLPAKPILDILVGVAPFENWRLCHDPLLALGYDYAADAGVPGHHIFGRGRDRSERTHLVHVVEFGGESWSDNLAFRDALRADAALRARYLAIKNDALVAAPEGRAAYNAAKAGAIAGLKAEIDAAGRSGG